MFQESNEPSPEEMGLPAEMQTPAQQNEQRSPQTPHEFAEAFSDSMQRIPAFQDAENLGENDRQLIKEFATPEGTQWFYKSITANDGSGRSVTIDKYLPGDKRAVAAIDIFDSTGGSESDLDFSQGLPGSDHLPQEVTDQVQAQQGAIELLGELREQAESAPNQS